MSLNTEPCPGCSTFLIEPFIRCTECVDPKPEICLHCFARGVEFRSHKNNHQYEVVKHNFHVLEKSWTAAQELQLLRAVNECGVGNWQDISNQLRTKTKQQCETHYFRYYLEGQHPDMPKFGNDDYDFVAAPVTLRYCEDPPRPAPNTLWQQDMAGYMAARGDFTMEHDNYAEMDIRDIYFDDCRDRLETEAKLTVLDIYQNRLREREQRKKIVKDYGLINLRKNKVFNHRYEKNLPFIHRLRVFMKLMTPMDFLKYIELLNYEYGLRHCIQTLQDLREAGITRVGGANVYKRLLVRKESEHSKRNMLDDILRQTRIQDEVACATWLQRQAALESLSKGLPATLPQASKRVCIPLDIVDLPGYEKLNEKERELCSSVRLIPEGFLKFKVILEDECKKNGSLKLAHARKMLNIDVNKTRKLYDYLLETGCINKDINM